MERIQVSVVTHDNEATIERCLKSVLDSEVLTKVEITVVDNGSSDNTVQAVRQHCPGVELIESADNSGFGAGHNRVLRRDGPEHVLLLNPDAWLLPHALERLIAGIRSSPQVALIAPRLEYPDGTAQVSFGPFPGLFADWRNRRASVGCQHRDPSVLRRVESQLTQASRPDWVSGACLLARRSALARIGYFDERFFLYFDDVDLCRRLRATGQEIILEPSARCAHLVGSSSGDASAMKRHFRHSRLLFENKHGSWPVFMLYRMLRARGDALRWDPSLCWTPSARGGESRSQALE